MINYNCASSSRSELVPFVGCKHFLLVDWNVCLLVRLTRIGSKTESPGTLASGLDSEEETQLPVQFFSCRCICKLLILYPALLCAESLIGRWSVFAGKKKKRCCWVNKCDLALRGKGRDGTPHLGTEKDWNCSIPHLFDTCEPLDCLDDLCSSPTCFSTQAL